MSVIGYETGNRHRTRRELVRQYIQLQRELIDGDPASSTYQSTIHAFRQLGYVLIASGFEDDLDRLLRIRVIDGDRPRRSFRPEPTLPELHVIERRPAP